MSTRESIDDVRTGIEALVASVQAGPPPAAGAGLAGSVMGRLRAVLERILRRQLAHQQTAQLQTLYLIHDLNTVVSRELFEVRQLLTELVHSAAETRASQGRIETALAKIEDRSSLTESLVDELTAALVGSGRQAELGRQGAPESR